jgi:hypothetical protein
MTVYTNEQAKRNLDAVLADASADGEVRIRRDDGTEFAIRPVAQSAPPRHPEQLCAQPQRDLSGIAGTWVDDPGFDDAITAQRQIDPDLWK